MLARGRHPGRALPRPMAPHGGVGQIEEQMALFLHVASTLPPHASAAPRNLPRQLALQGNRLGNLQLTVMEQGIEGLASGCRPPAWPWRYLSRDDGQTICGEVAARASHKPEISLC